MTPEYGIKTYIGFDFTNFWDEFEKVRVKTVLTYQLFLVFNVRI